MSFRFRALPRLGCAVIVVAAILLGACERENAAKPANHSSQSGNGVSGFDFYVLALSWSPSYCAAGGGKTDRQQCANGAGYSFIVHGLWPQFENGYPEYCSAGDQGHLSRSVINRYLDLTPSDSLLRHEWKKHGTCSGLGQSAYFDTVRAARERIIVPLQFRTMRRDRRIDPAVVEQAFVSANKGMARDGIAVTCDRRFVTEVRICLTQDLEFRACREVDRNGCGLASAFMPAPR